MTEIKIRNVSEASVAKIDKIATEKGMSRNEFLANEIDRIATEKESDKLEENYTKMCHIIANAIDKHTAMMNSFLVEAMIDEEEAYFLHREIDKLENIDTEIHEDDEKANINIKNIDKNIVRFIDEYAEKRGVSRNEFLIRYLRQLTYSSNMKKIDSKFEYLIEKAIGILDYSNRVFDLFYEENVID